MAPVKCCVIGCTSNNETHRLYNLPKDDKLRALWLSFLVPVNSELLFLTKYQLVKKRVCQKHFDRHQLDKCGKRLIEGYPCLFSAKEIEHGVPLSNDNPTDHTYCKIEDIPVITENKKDVQGDHSYPKPAFSSSSFSNIDQLIMSVLESDEMDSSEPSFILNETSEPSFIINESSESGGLITMDFIESSEIKQTNKSSIISPSSRSHINNMTTNPRHFIKNIKRIPAKRKKTRKPPLQSLDNANSALFNKKFDKMSQQAQHFLLMQLKMASRKKAAMRYTENEKNLALSLMKESPEGYRQLQKIFHLPSLKTLTRLAK